MGADPFGNFQSALAGVISTTGSCLAAKEMPRHEGDHGDGAKHSFGRIAIWQSDDPSPIQAAIPARDDWDKSQ
jgi:hypothetical protein